MTILYPVINRHLNLYSTSGTIGGFTIGADYLRTKADSRGYKFGMSSNAQPTGICSYIGKEGTDYDYVYRLGWDGSVETSKLTAGGAVFGSGRVYFEATEKAYLTKGDSVPIVFSTGGYTTGGGQTVAFFLPTRLIIGASKATLSFTSSEGIKVRQGGNYCYGSTAETNVRPTSQSISLSGESGVNVQLVMPNTSGLHDESKYKWLDPTPYIDADITGINTAEYKLNGLDYSPVFNPKYYLNKYSDLKAAFGSDYDKAWAHFKQYGMKEARQASAEFNVIAYKDNYADLRDAFGDNLPLYYEHYCNYGRKEGRNARMVEKKTLTLTSYPNYTSGNGFYRVRKSYRDEKNAIGSYCTWSSAYKTWKRYKSSGYHIYDKNGKQLD